MQIPVLLVVSLWVLYAVSLLRKYVSTEDYADIWFYWDNYWVYIPQTPLFIPCHLFTLTSFPKIYSSHGNRLGNLNDFHPPNQKHPLMGLLATQNKLLKTLAIRRWAKIAFVNGYNSNEVKAVIEVGSWRYNEEANGENFFSCDVYICVS